MQLSAHTHRRPDTTTAANNPTKTTPTHRQRSATNGHPTAGPLGANIREHGQVRGTGGGQRTAHGLVNDGHGTDRRLTETREATRAGAPASCKTPAIRLRRRAPGDPCS